VLTLKAKIRPDTKGMRDQRREGERFLVLREFGFSAHDASRVARFLEYRTVCHEMLGGVTVIEVD